MRLFDDIAFLVSNRQRETGNLLIDCDRKVLKLGHGQSS